MIQQPWGLRNFSLHVDNVGFAGYVTKAKLPDISVKTEDHKGAGMEVNRKLDHGIEDLELTFNSADFSDFLRNNTGILNNSETAIILRGALSDDSSNVAKAVRGDAKGTIIKVESAEWEPGTKTDDTYTMSLKYWKLVVDGSVTCEIDTDRLIRIIGGVDQMAGIRGAIQL